MSAESESKPTVNEIDRGYLADLTGDDHEFVSELMEAFLDSTPALLADLECAVAEGDTASAAYASHTLKGSCRSIGANGSADTAAAVEKAAREADVDAMRAALPAFVAHCRATLAEAEKLKAG